MSMTVKEAINKRYSTRYLDPVKKISNEDIETIIEAGRKAPSGFGTEPWKFIVVDGDTAKLSEATNNQPFVASASHMIAIVTYKKELIDEDPTVLSGKFIAAGFPEEQVNRTLEMITSYIPDQTVYYREQGMIAASQMVLQATELGIGTVIMGGFNPAAAAEVLGVDTTKYQVALLIALGYSTDTEAKQRVLRPYETVVEKVTL